MWHLCRSPTQNFIGMRRSVYKRFSFFQSAVTDLRFQNDRLYATAGTRKKQLPADRLLRKRSTFLFQVDNGVCWRVVTWVYGPCFHWSGHQDQWIVLETCRWNTCCQPVIRSVSGDFFTFQQDSAPAHRGASETVALLSAELLTSSVHWSGHRTARISIWWTKQFGGFCGSESTVVRSATSIIWKNDWLKSGVALIGTLLTEQWISGVIDCVV